MVLDYHLGFLIILNQVEFCWLEKEKERKRHQHAYILLTVSVRLKLRFWFCRCVHRDKLIWGLNPVSGQRPCFLGLHVVWQKL